MKKTLRTISVIMIILFVIGVAVVPVQTNAAFCLSAMDCVNTFAANIGYMILFVANSILNITAIFLSWSIKLTLGISEIYAKSDSIRNIWIIIRNLSSMFIIFMLIYTSIRTILDSNTTAVRQLIIKIILAGLLINFSLFFTKVLIDASNLVSLQFKRQHDK